MLPQLFKIGNFSVNSYGFMITLGVLVCCYLLKKEFSRRGYPDKTVGNMLFWVAIGAFVGTKVYYIIEHPEQFVDDLWASIFSGAGFVWYGALIGGSISIALFFKRNKLNVLKSFDLIAPVLLLLQAFGRSGCFLSGDGCYGPPSCLPWAMHFPNGVFPTLNNPQLQEIYQRQYPGSPLPADIAVHPTPLYDIILLTVLFLIIWNIRKRINKSGIISGWYLIMAGGERLLTDCWRLTPKYIWGVFSEAQMISLILIISGSVWLFFLFIIQPAIKKNVSLKHSKGGVI